MATTETLIRKRLLTNEELCDRLATFAGMPAIFFQSAADDRSEAWGDVQYPRIVFTADTFADAERERRKSLSIDIMCPATGTTPEEIEPYVRQSLAGVFFAPDDGETFSAKWRETQIFREQGSDGKLLINGMTASFDIYEYPLLETSDPDPIMAICRYAANWDKRLTVIGTAELAGIYEPTRENPAVYFSKGNTVTDRQTNTVVWQNTELVAHFFAPTLHNRIEWIEQFAQGLSLAGEVIMLDGSPMFLQRLTGNAAGDEITGQLTIAVQYGLLRRPKYAHTMMGAVLK